MDKSEIKRKRKRWIIASIIAAVIAVAAWVGIIFVSDINNTIGSLLCALCIFAHIAAVITFSLGMAVGTPVKKQRKHYVEEDKTDDEEFEEICEFDLMDDD